MRSLALALAVLLAAPAVPAGAQRIQGEPKGGVAYSLPAWFKPSFLDLREDVREAREQGRHVMLFLHLDECPYCARMLEDNFRRGENHDFMRRHFDVIAINVRGALEVTWTDGAAYSERTLTRHLKVVATPTIVFLDYDGNKVLQLAGYRDPSALGRALEYVQSESYRKPLAVLFEDRQCAECARFHERTLNHPDVLAEMKKFLFVRPDADSSAP
jgi:thioredoxin-related protein